MLGWESKSFPISARPRDAAISSGYFHLAKDGIISLFAKKINRILVHRPNSKVNFTTEEAAKEWKSYGSSIYIRLRLLKQYFDDLFVAKLASFAQERFKIYQLS